MSETEVNTSLRKISHNSTFLYLHLLFHLSISCALCVHFIDDIHPLYDLA